MNKLKKFENYNRNLERIIETINRDLYQTQDFVYYEASPEIVLGVLDKYSEFVKRKCIENLSEDNEEPTDIFNFYDDLSQSPISKIYDLTKEKVAIEVTKRLLHCFSYINRNYDRIERKNINPNRLFGVSVFGCEVSRLGNTYSENIRNNILDEVIRLNWNYICSTKNRKKIDKEIREFIFNRSTVINRRIEDLFNNSVEDRFENRRNIAVKIADYHSEETINYDEIVSRERRKYDSVKESLDKAIKERSPQFLIEKIKRSLKIKQYILSVLESENNFLIRYLKN